MKELPNLNRLRTQGSFRRLATSTPPQSPVAWSTFITGTDPSTHRIFDFVHRDAATLKPFSSLARTEDAGSGAASRPLPASSLEGSHIQPAPGYGVLVRFLTAKEFLFL